MTSDVYVHPLGLCESPQVGERTRVWAFAHVMPEAVVGADCNVCDHAFIESGAVLGDRVTVKNASLIWDGVTIGNDVFVGPNVVFTNDLRPRAERKLARADFLPTTVHDGATIGANATIVCGVSIGRYAFIAAGAVVTRDVAAHSFVAGNPARTRGWVCSCGDALSPDLACTCGRRYERVVDGELRALIPSSAV